MEFRNSHHSSRAADKNRTEQSILTVTKNAVSEFEVVRQYLTQDGPDRKFP